MLIVMLEKILFLISISTEDWDKPLPGDWALGVAKAYMRFFTSIARLSFISSNSLFLSLYRVTYSAML